MFLAPSMKTVPPRWIDQSPADGTCGEQGQARQGNRAGGEEEESLQSLMGFAGKNRHLVDADRS